MIVTAWDRVLGKWVNGARGMLGGEWEIGNGGDVGWRILNGGTGRMGVDKMWGGRDGRKGR